MSAATGAPRRNILLLASVLGGMLCVLLLVAGGIVYALRNTDGAEKKQGADESGQKFAQGNNKEEKDSKDEKKEPKVVKEEKKDTPPPKKIFQEPVMTPEIQAAVTKAAAHLTKRILTKGEDYCPDPRFASEAQIGALALGGLALLETKVPPTDETIKKVLYTVRDAGPKLELVYAIGAVLFFLNRLHDVAPLNSSDRELVRSMALRLIAGQVKDGRWSYINPVIDQKREEELLKQLYTNTYKPQHDTLPFHKPTHSMTQFALLALWVTQRHEVPARPALLHCAARMRQTQNPDGTWDYNFEWVGPILYDSNTCAGLIALAIDKALREDKEYKGPTANDPPPDPRAEERREKAFWHLAKVIGRTKEQSPANHDHSGSIIKADAWGDLYFLWCLERAAVIYDIKLIGGKDWYAWGSDVLLKSQKADGSWVDRHGDFLDTSFAILFLTRANLARDLTESIRKREQK